jgi:hypothetical protein
MMMHSLTSFFLFTADAHADFIEAMKFVVPVALVAFLIPLGLLVYFIRGFAEEDAGRGRKGSALKRFAILSTTIFVICGLFVWLSYT